MRSFDLKIGIESKTASVGFSGVQTIGTLRTLTQVSSSTQNGAYKPPVLGGFFVGDVRWAAPILTRFRVERPETPNVYFSAQCVRASYFERSSFSTPRNETEQSACSNANAANWFGMTKAAS